MNKISKFIKKNYKFIIGFVLGLVVASSSVYAANTIYSSNVTYDNSNSGLSATNVQDALDETYTKCFPPTIGINKIIELYESGPSFDNSSLGYYNIAQKILLDNNGDYRYSGAAVNNYVEFNNELWRIIGVFHDVDDGNGNKELRIKIIRSESIGKYAFGETADWTSSGLKDLLNTLYYNSQSGSCYGGADNPSATCDFTSIGLNSTARNMIDNAVYYLGELTGYGGCSTYYCYEDERSGDYYWIGKIGIIYPSDYTFARNYNVSDYKENWLYTGNVEWTISPWEYNDTSYGYNVVNFITSDGGIDNDLNTNTRTYELNSVLPVLYLKSDVIINGGTGTESDPYTLS